MGWLCVMHVTTRDTSNTCPVHSDRRSCGWSISQIGIHAATYRRFSNSLSGSGDEQRKQCISSEVHTTTTGCHAEASWAGRGLSELLRICSKGDGKLKPCPCWRIGRAGRAGRARESCGHSSRHNADGLQQDLVGLETSVEQHTQPEPLATTQE
jgi:hypothetical protein